MFEAFVYGIDGEGKQYPRIRMASTLCIQHLLDEYFAKYPTVVRVCMDIALPPEYCHEKSS